MASLKRKAERRGLALKTDELADRLDASLRRIAPGLVLFAQHRPDRGCFLINHERLVSEKTWWPDYVEEARKSVCRHRFVPKGGLSPVVSSPASDPVASKPTNAKPRIRDVRPLILDAARRRLEIRPSRDVEWLGMDLVRALHPNLAYLADRCDPRYECLVVLDPMRKELGTCVELAQYLSMSADHDGEGASLFFVSTFLDHERVVPQPTPEHVAQVDTLELSGFYNYSDRCSVWADRFGMVDPLRECFEIPREEFDGIRVRTSLSGGRG